MKDLFYALYQVDSEKEINDLIKITPTLLDSNNWKPYGGNYGNFGTFEGQQNNSIAALIEKITNSIDATLISKCLLSGVAPDSNDAPKTMAKAVELFYNVPKGEVGELTDTERRELAEKIQVIATGDRHQPSITIFDEGEGQHPKDFEKTFLSLHSNNKAKIHFVQGKYNMGSTGAVVFCGDKKYQLIASKRNPSLCDNNNNNPIGFTLVRKHPLHKDEEVYYKSTWYEYFCPNGKVPEFIAEDLNLGLYRQNFMFGSIVKLYSYQLPSGSRSNITLDLWRDLNQYLYNLPLPILVYEKRPDYSGKSPDKLVLGNRTRINVDSRDSVEKFISINLSQELDFGEVLIQVIVFKSHVQHNEFIKNKSLIFTQNGQVHAFEGQSFVSQTLGFQLLKKHVLIHVDCTNIRTSIRQDLFMSNRTQLKESPRTESLKQEIVEILKQNDDLRRLNNERKNSLLRDSSSDRKLIEQAISKLPLDKDVLSLLKHNGSLSAFRSQGNQMLNHTKRPKQEIKVLNRYPSIFNLNLKENKNGKMYKTIPLNSKGIVTIDTDVEDDYLFRPVDRGEFQIQVLQKRNLTDTPVNLDPNPTPNVVTDILLVNSVGPSNGTIKLLIKPNEKAQVGDLIEIRATLTAPGEDLSCMFEVKVDKKISEPKKEKKKAKDSFPDLPRATKAYEKPTNEDDLSWDDENLKWTGNDIVKVISSSNEGQYIVDNIIINMDSFTLLKFISKNAIKTENDLKFIKNKYFLAIYLHSMFLYSIVKKMSEENEHLKHIELDEFIANLIKSYANFLLYHNYNLEKMAFD